jgi:hypothetical protein
VGLTDDRAEIGHWGAQQEADAEDVTQMVLVRLAERKRTFAYYPSNSFRSCGR